MRLKKLYSVFGKRIVWVEKILLVNGYYRRFAMNESSITESADQSMNKQNVGNAPALWNPEAASAWSLIFTPIFGSALVLMNWQALEKKEQIRTAQIWLIVSIIMLFVQLAFGIPSLAILYFGIWYFASGKVQAKYVKELWGKEYPRRSWLWPLIIGFVAWIILLGAIFIFSFIGAFLSS